MSGAGRIGLRPELCDHCGRCVPACARRLVKVTGSHLYVDPKGCDGCMACVSACSKGAIVRASSTAGRAVVGSRAEAKALKKASQKASQKASSPISGQVAAAVSSAVGAAAPTIGSRAVVGAKAATAAGEPRAASGSTQPAWRAATTPAEMPGAAAWTLVDAAIIVGVVFAVFLGSEAILSSRAIALMPQAGQALARGSVLGLFALVEIVALSVLARRHGMSLRVAFSLSEADRSGQERIADGVLVLGLLVGLRMVSLLWGVLARAVHLAVPAGERLVAVFGSGPVGLVLSAVIVVAITPVAEELIFRGVVQKALAQRFGAWPAIAGSAAVFALLHFTPWMFVPVFALGMAAGWLAWNRGSLGPAIALHVLYNGSAIAAAFWLAR